MSRPSNQTPPATSINPDALKKAAQALVTHLRSEAENQNAFLISFPDGRISLELEWISLEEMAKEVIQAYRQADTASVDGAER